MNHPDAWQRLVAAARRAPDERPLSAPYGFAVRVSALGLAARSEPASVFAALSFGLSLRALAAASLLAVASAGFSYPEMVKVFSPGALPAPARSLAVPAVATLPDLPRDELLTDDQLTDHRFIAGELMAAPAAAGWPR